MQRNLSNNSKKNFKIRSVTFNQGQSMEQSNGGKETVNKDMMDKLFKKAKRVRPGLAIQQTYGNSRALVGKCTLPSINNNILKDLEEQRQQLENLRLQEDSQSTRLMKIQKHERSVTLQYENQKKEMERDLDQLANQASQHNKKQKEMNQQLENVEKIAILNYDKKIKYFKDQMMKDKEKNVILEREIRECEIDIDQKKDIIEQKNIQIEELQIYEKFLQEIEMNFREDEYTEGIHAIINKFEQLDKIQEDLTIEDQNYDQEINKITKETQILRAKIGQNNIKGTSDMNKVKKEIEIIQEENRKMEDNQLSIEKQKLQKQIDQGQLIMAIKNIYSSVVSNNNQKSLIQQQYEFEQALKKNKKLNQQPTLQQTAEKLLLALDLQQEKVPTIQEQHKQREEKIREKFQKNQISKDQMVKIIKNQKEIQEKENQQNENTILTRTLVSQQQDSSHNMINNLNINEEEIEEDKTAQQQKKHSESLKNKLQYLSEQIKQQKQDNYKKEIEDNNREQKLKELLENQKKQQKNKPKEDSTSYILQMLKLIQKTMIHLQKVEQKYDEKAREFNSQYIMNTYKQ